MGIDVPQYENLPQPPPYDDRNVEMEVPCEMQNQQTECGDVPQVAGTVRFDMAEMFHAISICCALLSLFTSSLIELIPMILWFFFRQHLELQTVEKHRTLHRVDSIVTAICFGFLFGFLLVFGILSFGIGLIFMVFLIPYVVVLVQLNKTAPKSTQLEIIEDDVV
uniref:Uncharacterized protein n=1 Tax=Vannella robusta TaxID=1487602 RepID=A0A7S4IJW0_9EUKA|mmetsp:Transcript_3660/g.4518  ORF Transcript_3660/g.4518 Transcript_3660/m.4518 type:complete len:165 (+) Transcript_3660:51-545(+)